MPILPARAAQQVPALTYEGRRKTSIRCLLAPAGGYNEVAVLRSPQEPGRVRVLLVDDEPIVRDVGRALVQATAGFVVAGEADSGEAALEAVAELHPDLVIMDRRMGPLDGISATRLITERHPGVAVLLVSVGPLEEGALDGCGAVAFVRKQDLSPEVLRSSWEDWTMRASEPRVGTRRG